MIPALISNTFFSQQNYYKIDLILLTGDVYIFLLKEGNQKKGKRLTPENAVGPTAINESIGNRIINLYSEPNGFSDL